VKSKLVSNRTLSILLSMKSVSVPAFVLWANISNSFTQAVEKTKQFNEFLAKVSKM